jgi:hypothetical protein
VAREHLGNGGGSPLDRSGRKAFHRLAQDRIAGGRLSSCNSVVTPLGLASFMPARRMSREIEELVQAFIRRLSEAVESATSARGYHALRRIATRRRRRANLMILVSLAGTIALAALLGSVLSR